MNIVVVTTVAQHRAGLQLHLSNLRWALQHHNVRYIVQTFSEWDLKAPDVQFVNHNHFPYHYFRFWDHTDKHLSNYLNWADVFLFMEQDILFSRVVEDIPHDPVVLNLESYYLSIYTPSVDRLYPRIWDGATFVPSRVVSRALGKGVCLGSTPRQTASGGCLDTPLLDTFHTSAGWPWNDLPTIRQFLSMRAHFDTMFEFGLFCFATHTPVIKWTKLENDYQFSDYVVHIRGIDTLVLDCPSVYEDLSKLGTVETSREWLEWFYNDCALMLLLSGVHGPSSVLAGKLLQSYSRPDPAWLKLDRPGSIDNVTWLRKKLELLEPRAEEWMDPEVFERYLWAKGVLSEERAF